MTKPMMRERYAARARAELIKLVEHDARALPEPSNRAGRVRLAVAVVLALALVVPASLLALTSRPGPAPAQQQSEPAAASQALQLVPAIWRVRDAAAETPDTWIVFDSGISLIRPKGDVYLSWSTQRDSLLTHVESWSMSLGTSKPPAVPWLTSTTRFVRNGDGWALLDAEGHRTARLVHDGTPPPSKQALHEVPKVKGLVLQQHTDAVLGAAVRSVKQSATVGTWGLPGIATADGSLSLRSDGTWTTKTTCDVLGDANGGGGAYRVLPTGFALVTAGGVAGVGCMGPETPPPAGAAAILEFYRTGSIAIAENQMTVYDREGKKLGTLERKSKYGE